jgi:GGDEF domain-containing protein
MVMVAEPKSLSEIASAYGEHRRDLALVEAADHLRTLVGPTDLLGRLGETRFGLAIFDTGLESVEEIWARIHSSAAGHRILIGAAIFDADRPASLEALLDQAILDLTPSALAMRR